MYTILRFVEVRQINNNNSNNNNDYYHYYYYYYFTIHHLLISLDITSYTCPNIGLQSVLCCI